MWRDQPNILHPRHTGSPFYLPQGGHNARTSESMQLGAPISFHSLGNCGDTREQTRQVEGAAADATENKLLARYRVENERLREQLKAQAVHTKLLEQRLHELSARNTALYLQDFRKREDEAEVGTLKKKLEDREREVHALQLQVAEQAGRISSFEEAVSRPLPDADAAVASLSSPRTHELLCQALSSVGFLTRVFNAIRHCQNTPHEGPECKQPLQQCKKQCLQAAMRGNRETVAEVMGRGHRTTCEELALALREEVLFCERSAVQIAAQLLAEQETSADVEKTPGVEAVSLPAEMETTVPQENIVISPVRESRELPSAPRRATRRHVTRPKVEDCEVQ